MSAQFVILDRDSAVIEVGGLRHAYVHPSSCMLSFDLDRVPAGRDRYGTQVADLSPYWYAEDDMHTTKGIGY